MPINKYISMIGVELEGAWRAGPPSNPRGDGSVRFEPNHGFSYVGESPSPAFPTWGALVDHVTRDYPDGVNASCGMHVHYSFNSVGIYRALMDRAFYRFFVGKMRTWGMTNVPPELGWIYNTFWDRLNGNNTYTRHDYFPDEQARANGRISNRYTLWNYCLRLHGTAECRMLPMFPDAEQALAAIRAQRDIVTLWIDQNQTEKIIYDNNQPTQAIEPAPYRLALPTERLDPNPLVLDLGRSVV